MTDRPIIFSAQTRDSFWAKVNKSGPDDSVATISNVRNGRRDYGR